MATLDDLRPTTKQRVMDLVEAAGHDVSVWSKGFKNPSQPSSNPKYCYEWSFLQDGQPAIFNLWHDQLVLEDGAIRLKGNFRAQLKKYEKQPKRSNWRTRAKRFDDALRLVWAHSYPVRVILNDGSRRRIDDIKARPSVVMRRELDTAAWSLTRYDDASGAFELTRGSTAFPGTIMAPDLPHVDPYLFEKQFDAFRRFIEQRDGVPFVSFSSSPYLDGEEGYKYAVHASGREHLASGDWSESSVGTGVIADAVIRAIEIQGSNLVPWQARFGLEARPHHALYAAQENPDDLVRAERALYGLYRTQDDAQSFDALVDLFGKKYSLLAYLMFLKDRSRYLPIATTTFDTAFEILGVTFSTAHKCSWDNYLTFVRLIGEVKQLLGEVLEGEVTLVDAHSFAWVLARQMKDASALANVSEYTALPESERRAVGLARVGQGEFRRSLIRYWQRCSVTGVAGEGFLTASHIRPWSGATTADRLNPFNGFLLSPALNACFDKGYVTFDDEGMIVLSEELGSDDATLMGIHSAMKLARVDDRHRPFLAHHREHVFKKSATPAQSL